MVSIIIAVYNGEKYIEETITSALRQTISKEIIIIDDCSSDNSYELIKQIAEKNTCIKILKNEKNMGFCKSVNKGLKQGKGKYVLVLGQDDILLPNHCEIMLKSFDYDTSIVFCDYNLIDQDGNIYDTTNHCIHSDKSVKDFYKGNAIPSVGLIMDKNKLVKVGGYPESVEFPQYGEYHTWIRMVLEGDIIFCENIKAKYRRHKDNMTNNFNERKIRKRLNKYFITCKTQILKSPNISLLDKCYIFIYIQYRTLKVFIFGR